MTLEVTKELIAMKDISEATSEWGVSGARRVETQRSQKVMLDSLKNSEEFGSVSKSK